MEKREPSYTAGGNVNWWATIGTMDNSMEVPQKARVVIRFSNPAPGHIPGENCNQKRYTWMDLEIIITNEVSHKEKDKYILYH